MEMNDSWRRDRAAGTPRRRIRFSIELDVIRSWIRYTLGWKMGMAGVRQLIRGLLRLRKLLSLRARSRQVWRSNVIFPAQDTRGAPPIFRHCLDNLIKIFKISRLNNILHFYLCGDPLPRVLSNEATW